MAAASISPDRRRFFTDTARMAAGCALAGGGLMWLARDACALPADALRPPGALPQLFPIYLNPPEEADFTNEQPTISNARIPSGSRRSILPSHGW